MIIDYILNIYVVAIAGFFALLWFILYARKVSLQGGNKKK